MGVRQDERGDEEGDGEGDGKDLDLDFGEGGAAAVEVKVKAKASEEGGDGDGDSDGNDGDSLDNRLPFMLASLKRVALTVHDLQGRCARLSHGETDLILRPSAGVAASGAKQDYVAASERVVSCRVCAYSFQCGHVVTPKLCCPLGSAYRCSKRSTGMCGMLIQAI